MAVAAGIWALYSVAMFLKSVIQFLIWCCHPRVNAVVKKLQEKSFDYGKNGKSDKLESIRYSYLLEVQTEGSKDEYIYVETVGPKGKSRLKIGETYSVCFNAYFGKIKMMRELVTEIGIWAFMFVSSIIIVIGCIWLAQWL